MLYSLLETLIIQKRIKKKIFIIIIDNSGKQTSTHRSNQNRDMYAGKKKDKATSVTIKLKEIYGWMRRRGTRYNGRNGLGQGNKKKKKKK